AARSTTAAAGGFSYHEDHDAWTCSEDQWLWPMSFDPDNRVTRYRASPTVCNPCPVKDNCTTSHSGREVVRNIDSWPSSEAERFHRGIACAVVVLGFVWPLAVMLQGRTALELLVLGGASAAIAAGSWPLWSHLRRAPARFPEHLRTEGLDDSEAARAVTSANEIARRSGYGAIRKTGTTKGNTVRASQSARWAELEMQADPGAPAPGDAVNGPDQPAGSDRWTGWGRS
ncbi:MAG: hypothetical protein H7311_05745, partial [Ramlibacter sp.]|nr:hypothetical protein [Cryobacterium sp.]